MACNPNCPYLRIVGKNMQYTKNKFGVKLSTSKLECEYDEKEIKSWDKDCPKNKKGEII